MPYAHGMVQILRRMIVCWAGASVLAVAAAAPALAQGITVATDSSLGPGMKAVVQGFEAAHAGVSVKLLLGASGALLERIAEGTAADVLAGADAETVALGVQRRLLLSDLARPEVARIAMGRQTSVPAGRYAREAIDAQRMWPSVQRKVVIAEDAREVLGLVAGADVEAGFVYATDVAAAAGRVRVVETMATTTPIRHLANVVAGSRNPELAREFVAYLRSEAAHEVFKRFGFGIP